MEEQIKKWISRIESVRKGNLDLSRDEDLSIALMNLISLEEHFYFTAMKTDDSSYLNMLDSIRELRKKLLKKIVKDPKGEEWCISKHLLAASMRLMEVGTKELSKGNKAESLEMFNSAYQLYSLFFAINTKIIQPQDIKKEIKSNTFLDSISNIIKKIVDCCKE